MYALDFEYDGQYLSDYGFIISDIGGTSDMDVVSAGSTITFNTIPINRGKRYSKTGTKYESCIQANFDICKNTDIYDDLRISDDEYRDLARWLNREEFLKLQFLNDGSVEQESCYYNASFNIEKITVNKELYGVRLTMETDSPFGYGQEFMTVLNINDTQKRYTITDMSDAIGYTYPVITVTCKENGNLTIRNETENCISVIQNCSAGEVITMDGATGIISSSMDSHHLYDDFNFEYIRIGNTIENRNNKITVSLQCRMEIRYSPIIKNSPY